MDNFISKKLKLRFELCFERGKDDLVALRNLGTDCTVISDETLFVCSKFIVPLYGEATTNLNHLRYNTWRAANFRTV